MPRVYREGRNDEEKPKVELELQLSEGKCAEVVAKLIKSLRDLSNTRNKLKTRCVHDGGEKKYLRNKCKMINTCQYSVQEFNRKYLKGYTPGENDERRHNIKRRQSKRREEEDANEQDREWKENNCMQGYQNKRRRNEEYSRRNPKENVNLCERQRMRHEDYARQRRDGYRCLRDIGDIHPSVTRDEDWTRSELPRNDRLRNEGFGETRHRRNSVHDFSNSRHEEEFRAAKQSECPEMTKQYCGKNTEQAGERHGASFGNAKSEGNQMLRNFDSICQEVKQGKRDKKLNQKRSQREKKQKVKECKKAVKVVVKRCKAQEKAQRNVAKENLKQSKKEHKKRIKELKTFLKHKKKEEKMNEKMRAAAAKAKISDLKRKLKLECKKIGYGAEGAGVGNGCTL